MSTRIDDLAILEHELDRLKVRKASIEKSLFAKIPGLSGFYAWRVGNLDADIYSTQIEYNRIKYGLLWS